MFYYEENQYIEEDDDEPDNEDDDTYSTRTRKRKKVPKPKPVAKVSFEIQTKMYFKVTVIVKILNCDNKITIIKYKLLGGSI